MIKSRSETTQAPVLAKGGNVYLSYAAQLFDVPLCLTTSPGDVIAVVPAAIVERWKRTGENPSVTFNKNGVLEWE